MVARAWSRPERMAPILTADSRSVKLASMRLCWVSWLFAGFPYEKFWIETRCALNLATYF
jgi:hypothetical protein